HRLGDQRAMLLVGGDGELSGAYESLDRLGIALQHQSVALAQLRLGPEAGQALAAPDQPEDGDVVLVTQLIEIIGRLADRRRLFGDPALSEEQVALGQHLLADAGALGDEPVAYGRDESDAD